MNVGKTLFAQVMEYVPWKTFGRMSWQVELFFKWIKQHLRIKRFLGTSENAVKTQRCGDLAQCVWCAVSTCVLIAIVKKELHLNVSLYTLLFHFQIDNLFVGCALPCYSTVCGLPSRSCLSGNGITDSVGLGFRENPYFMRLAAGYHQKHSAATR